MIKNPKYLPNKKNNNNPPEITDERVKYVPIGCGNCIECRNQNIVTGKQIGRAHV